MIWLSVALGGALGAMSRYAVSLLWPFDGKHFPWGTFIANAVGCFVMAVLYVLIVHKQLLPVAWRPLIGVGFLGAFTTFSTFSLEALILAHHQQWGMAILYAVLTMVACLLCAAAGFMSASLIAAQH